MPSTRPSALASRLTSRACPPCTVASRRRTVHARLGYLSVASPSKLCIRSYACTQPRAGKASTSTQVGCTVTYESCPLSHPAAAPSGYTQRIVGIPKAESDAILAFLFAQIAQNHAFHVRYRWEVNDVAIWDNRVKCFFSPPSTKLRPSARL